MCNGVAIATHTNQGDAILVDCNSHILRSETGGAAVLASVIVDQLPSNRGQFMPEDVVTALPGESVYVAPATLALCRADA